MISIFWTSQGYEVACISEMIDTCLSLDSFFLLQKKKKEEQNKELSLEQGLSSHVMQIAFKSI